MKDGLKRILIFNVNWLGDVLFSTAAIRNIRRNFPEMFQAGTLIFSIVDYVYTVCLILIFVIAFALAYYRSLPSKDTNS